MYIIKGGYSQRLKSNGARCMEPICPVTRRKEWNCDAGPRGCECHSLWLCKCMHIIDMVPTYKVALQ